MSGIERKMIPLTDVKTAEGADGKKEMRFKGYGAVFGNVDSYGDVIDAGAFAKTLEAAQKSGNFPAMLMQHGGWGITSTDMTPIGVWDTLAEDGKGLMNDGILAETPRGIEAYTLLSMKPRPAINGLSIGYVPKKFTMRSKAEEPRRRLHEVDLLEVSLVTFPANGLARITGVKSGLPGAGYTTREFEQLMQDAGLTRSEARIVLTKGFNSLLVMQDADSTELKDLAESIRRTTAALTL